MSLFSVCISNGVAKKLLKIIGKKKTKVNKNVLLGRSKCSSIENIISKALIDDECIHKLHNYS